MAFEQEPEGKVISVKLEKAVADKAADLAQKGKISRQRFLYNVLKIGADDALSYDFLFQISFLTFKMKNVIYKKDESQIVNIPLKVETTLVEKLDTVASNWNTTRHDAMKQIITIGVEETARFDRLGLTKAAIVTRDIHDAFKSLISKSESIYQALDEEERRSQRP